MNWVIYVLKCPRTDQVRYVGFTSQKASARLSTHISEAVKLPKPTHRTKWILSLLSIGLRPFMEVIESGSGDGWQEAERRWIAHYRALGAKLVNNTDGGEGVFNWGTPELRSAIARKREAAKTPERRSAIAKRRQEAITPAERSEIARKPWAALTAEQRSVRARHWQAAISPEARNKAARARVAATTPDERSETMRKQWANLTAEQRSVRARHWQAAITAEARRETAKKREAHPR